MISLAALRPDTWNLPLFLHILGAMVAVGGLVIALVYLTGALRGGSSVMFRAGYRSLIWFALPGFVVMRVAGQWLLSEEGLEDVDPEPAWVGIGYIAGEAGLLFLLIATVVAGVGSRRALAAGSTTGHTRSIRVASALVGLMIVVYAIAIWAMTTKPL